MAIEKFQPMRKRFVKLTLRTKCITPSKRTLKTMSKNGVGSCVHFCLRLLGFWEDVINKKASRLSLLGLGSGTVVLMGPCKKTVFGTTGFISVCSYSHLSHKKALPLIGLQTGHKFGTY